MMKGFDSEFTVFLGEYLEKVKLQSQLDELRPQPTPLSR